MPKTLKEIAEVAELEGLHYALTDGGYLKPEDFEDEYLQYVARMFIASSNILDHALRDYYP